MRRRGFALLIVLWTVLGATAASMATNGVAQGSLDAARNRRNRARAHWRAADCLERARSLIEASLQDQDQGAMSTGEARVPWRMVDRTLAARSQFMPADCTVTARASGSAVDVNSAGAELLVNLFRALGRSPASADSLKDALLDWRDADDVTRPLGAERAWYRNAGRPEPRNAPLANIEELARVRGFESIPALGGPAVLVDVERGRIALDNAPLAVLQALPGFGPEAVARVAELRSRNAPMPDLVAFAGTLSPAGRSAMLARYADLTRLTTLDPDSWIVTATGVSGSPAVHAVIEVVLVRAGARAAITRRRTWVE